MAAHLIIDPKVADELGVSVQGLAAQTLGDFVALAHYKGFDVRMSGFDRAEPPKEGSLTVKMIDTRPIIQIEG